MDFRHSNLDQTKLSTRLIKVERRRRDGYIRCKVWHAVLPRRFGPGKDSALEENIATDQGLEDGVLTDPWTGEEQPLPPYSCLSYTWGDPDADFGILMNNKPCRVRGNLCDFLNSAQNLLNDTFLWIDALCIDQDNVLERNHQVQQMGSIYSGADTVVIWLGRSASIARVLERFKRGDEEDAMGLSIDHTSYSEAGGFAMKSLNPLNRQVGNSSTTDNELASINESDVMGEAKHNVFLDSTGKAEKILECITSHPYWSRAWVTQEVLLARRATLMALTSAHDLYSLARMFRANVPHFRENAFDQTISFVLQARSYFDERSSLSKLGVVNLLDRFRNKDCSIKRDRIYSLLALCKEGLHLTVDYEVSEKVLFQQVLSLRESSMCFCSAAIVVEALSPWDVSTHDEGNAAQAFAEIHMYGLALSSASCPSCGNWVPFSWTCKKGFVFCLSMACPDTQGHMFYEQQQTQEKTEPECSRPPAASTFIQERDNNKSHLLCDNDDGVEVCPSQWSKVYRIRFSFSALAKLLAAEFSTTGMGLNACPNLWPTSEKGPVAKEGRLHFCGEA
ncbi:hypothetical protein ACN47E_001830 [Coniothyrium glycines]